MRGKVNQLDFTKTKTCSSRNIKKMKKTSHRLGEIFVKHISGKGFISKT